MEFWCLSSCSIYYPKIDLAIEIIGIFFLFTRKARRIAVSHYRQLLSNSTIDSFCFSINACFFASLLWRLP